MPGKTGIAVVSSGVIGYSPTGKHASVQKFPLFSGVPPADCATIISRGFTKQFQRRQHLFSIGDRVDHVLLLLSGSVKITQVGFKGSEVILRVSAAGDLEGTFGLWPECKHNSSAQAIQPCTAVVWDLATFARLWEQFALFRRNTFRALEQRLHEMELRVREISTEDVSSRLSSELIRLSNRSGYGVDGNPEVRLTHTDLAQLTGTTLSTVSRLLSRWQKLGIVSAGPGGVQIRDIAALAKFSETE
ncbi:MAG TPA: Crp/Fnr family transcriptional regulator [Candidatus Sulfotelmatobacter sp.]|nr:Crp/Fnr family transcriptional regulator [Candidatus Sulfotelmatobacter sp.]